MEDHFLECILNLLRICGCSGDSGSYNKFIANIEADLNKHVQGLLTPVRGMNELFIGCW